jgi:hypothetical protein
MSSFIHTNMPPIYDVKAFKAYQYCINVITGIISIGHVFYFVLLYNVGMAINTPISTDTTAPRTKVLKNGAVYDMNKGRIVANPGGGTHAITSANARDMQKLAVERKREVVAHAANRAVQDRSLLAEYGDYAHVAERAMTLQMIATTPEAGKAAVMAHQALIADTGMSEKALQDNPTAPTVGDMAGLVDALAAFVAAVKGNDSVMNVTPADDGDIIE